MVDFSFIVSLYVSDLLNVTISTGRYITVPVPYSYKYEHEGTRTSTSMIWIRFFYEYEYSYGRPFDGVGWPPIVKEKERELYRELRNYC